MSTVSQQYLKDKSGNKFSPITSTKSVYKGTEDLETILDKIEYYQPGELMRDCSNSNYSFPTSAADYSPSQNQIFTYMQFNIQINPDWSTQRLAWVECNGISFKF